MAKRRYQGFGKPYYKQSLKGRGGWFVRFYEPGAIVTYRLVKHSEHKR